MGIITLSQPAHATHLTQLHLPLELNGTPAWDVVRTAAQPRLVLLDDLSAFAKGDCINPR